MVQNEMKLILEEDILNNLRTMNILETVSPIDGRYSKHTQPLNQFFSEKAFHSYRIKVECEYLLLLSEDNTIDTRKFSSIEKDIIKNLHAISLEDAELIKKIEYTGHNSIKATNHDVKAIEYFIKEKLKDTSLYDSLQWIHFAITSEDINNIAYGLMLSDTLESIILPKLNELHSVFENLAKKYSDIPMLARTHGQYATPTSLGKEFKVFSSRIERQISQLSTHKILVKLNGATGNYNAHHVAYPKINFLDFTQQLINNLNYNRIKKIEANFITTQIEPGDSYSELFDNMKRINTILIDFNQDMWRYISDNWIVQKAVEGEIGSSTMPHKINPICFENSEGNLGIANALFQHFSTKLPISRLQRDLSDSTVKRNFGVSFGHSLIGYNSILSGLKNIDINYQKIKKTLHNHPEIISEAIQTILRKDGVQMSYEHLKDLTRGKELTIDDFHLFINDLSISVETKELLKKITPENYIGIAETLIGL